MGILLFFVLAGVIFGLMAAIKEFSFAEGFVAFIMITLLCGIGGGLISVLASEIAISCDPAPLIEEIVIVDMEADDIKIEWDPGANGYTYHYMANGRMKEVSSSRATTQIGEETYLEIIKYNYSSNAMRFIFWNVYVDQYIFHVSEAIN